MINIKSIFLMVALLAPQCNYSGDYNNTALLPRAESNCENWTMAPSLTSGFALGLSCWARAPKTQHQKNTLNMMRLCFLTTGITSTLGAMIVNPCDSDRTRIAQLNATACAVGATCGLMCGVPISMISAVAKGILSETGIIVTVQDALRKRELGQDNV